MVPQQLFLSCTPVFLRQWETVGRDPPTGTVPDEAIEVDQWFPFWVVPSSRVFLFFARRTLTGRPGPVFFGEGKRPPFGAVRGFLFRSPFSSRPPPHQMF